MDALHLPRYREIGSASVLRGFAASREITSCTAPAPSRETTSRVAPAPLREITSCTALAASRGTSAALFPRVALIILLAAAFLLPPRNCSAREFLVAVDIGHSPASKGTPSARNRPEYEFNRRMSLALVREINRSRRLRAVPINLEGEDITLSRRAEIINAAKPDLVISVHHDSVRPGLLSNWTYKGKPAQYCDRFRGYSIFISRKNGHPKASRLIALALGSEMRKAGFLPSNHHTEDVEGERREPVDAEKGVYFYDGLVVLKETKAPALLLECGIIRNRAEELFLRNRLYRSRMAKTVRAAIESRLRSPASSRKIVLLDDIPANKIWK